MDKELRYLSIVGLRQPFNRHSRDNHNCPSLRFDHWAGIISHTLPYGFAENCVFTKQSVFPILCDSAHSHAPSTLSPEVTGPFCLVPLGWFSPRLSSLKPIHLRRITVRSHHNSRLSTHCSTRIHSFSEHSKILQNYRSRLRKLHSNQFPSCPSCTPDYPSTTPFGFILGIDSP